MKAKIVLVLVGVGLLAIVAFALLAAQQPPPIDVATLPVGVEQIVDKALMKGAAGDPQAQMLDVRLGYRSTILRAVGAAENYDPPPADWGPEVDTSDWRRPDEPVWVVIVLSDNLTHLPFVAEGPGTYHGFYSILSAETGYTIRRLVFSDLSTVQDEMANLQKLPDQAAGKIPPDVVARIAAKGHMPPEVVKRLSAK